MAPARPVRVAGRPRTDAIDAFIREVDRGLRTVAGTVSAARPYPGEAFPSSPLAPGARAHTASLMRVNHCGEVCAQALYQGQALTARQPGLASALRKAADEELDHLAWTSRRIRELGGRPSLLNPLWYAGSLAIGLLAGRAGASWNLGFLRETERQVEAHLRGHLARLPADDLRTRAVVERMQADEAGHAATAQKLGGRSLPAPARWAMRAASRLMTTTAYWL